MIAVSTFKPQHKSAEIARNQIRGIQSWYPFFDRIFLIGAPEPDFTHEKVTFVGGEDYPTIHDMIALLADVRNYPGYPDGQSIRIGTWLNADIVLRPPFENLKALMTQRPQAATSWRMTYSPEYEKELAGVYYDPADFGMDIFVARQPLWEFAERVVHPKMRVACLTHDSWLCGFFNKVTVGHVYDFSKWRCVLHPKHGDRSFPAKNELAWADDEYGRCAGFPRDGIE
jgi:hypothetical protein